MTYFCVAQAWRLCWQWKVCRLSMTFVLQTVSCQGGDWSGEQTKKCFKKRKKSEEGDMKGGSENSSGHFKCHFGSQISLKSTIQVIRAANTGNKSANCQTVIHTNCYFAWPVHKKIKKERGKTKDKCSTERDRDRDRVCVLHVTRGRVLYL